MTFRGGGILTILFFVFVFWALLADSPEARMDRACRPTLWTGNLFVSLSELVYPRVSESVQDAFFRMDYGCEYMLWRLLYEDAYLEAVQRGEMPGQGLQ